MSEEVQVVQPKRRINLVWLLPVIAGLLGIYMVVYTYLTEGPEITIVFSTAEGMTAGNTKIKGRSVEGGTVDAIVLAEDLEHVVVTASIDATAEKLLRDDTQFWVVRARVGPGGITGLATILSGGYIELAPGEGAPGRKHFDGLEDPPVTAAGAAGLHVILTSTKAGSVSAGDAVLFRGYRVGRVETAELDLEARVMNYSLFIEAPYDSLVSEGTRFWNASGLSLTAGTDGIDFEMSSLSSLIPLDVPSHAGVRERCVPPLGHGALRPAVVHGLTADARDRDPHRVGCGHGRHRLRGSAPGGHPGRRRACSGRGLGVGAP